MYLYDFAIQNRELVKLVYTVVIGLICFLIVIKTNRLFKLSFHQGIRYFRNAFFFYGLAFIARYLFSIIFYFTPSEEYFMITKGVFEFFLTMAGFFLLYSLLWKKFEPEKGSYSSLFNKKTIIFYFLSIIIAVLDILWSTYFFMFILQILIFVYTSILSYVKYKRSDKKSFLGLYFFVMILNLIVWLANFIVATFLDWHKSGLISIYLLNVVIFLLFLYAVMRITRKTSKK